MLGGRCRSIESTVKQLVYKAGCRLISITPCLLVMAHGSDISCEQKNKCSKNRALSQLSTEASLGEALRLPTPTLEMNKFFLLIFNVKKLR